jgi:subtilisin-like proprotein convertase family protein
MNKARWSIAILFIVALFALVMCTQPGQATPVVDEAGLPRAQGGSCTTYTKSGSVTIPDDDETGITSTITLPPVAGKVTYVRLSIGIDHNNPTDLSAYLSTPNLCESMIFSNQLADTGFTGALTFANDGAKFVDFTDYPYAQMYKPNAPFSSNFRAGGRWKLHMIDSASYYEGALTDWSLTLCTDGATIATPTPWATSAPTATPIPPGVYLFDNEDYGTCSAKFAAGAPTIVPGAGVLYTYDAAMGNSAYVTTLICNAINADVHVSISGSASASQSFFDYETPGPGNGASAFVDYYYYDYIDPGGDEGGGCTGSCTTKTYMSTCHAIDPDHTPPWFDIDYPIYKTSASYSNVYTELPWHQTGGGSSDYNSYINESGASGGQYAADPLYCPPIKDAAAELYVYYTPGPTYTPSPTPTPVPMICGTPRPQGGWGIF